MNAAEDGIVLGIVPARGGSKGIKRKNLYPLCGKPLIKYTLDAALASTVLDDLLISTDDQEIQEYCNAQGVPVPTLRPAELAADESTTVDAVKFELDRYEQMKGVKVKTIVLLQPTSPLRTAKDIDDAYSAYVDSGLSSLVSCCEVGGVHPRLMYRKNDQGALIAYVQEPIVRRQNFEKVYIRNGALYICAAAEVKERNRLVTEAMGAYAMPHERSINIDDIDDLQLAEKYLSGVGKFNDFLTLYKYCV